MRDAQHAQEDKASYSESANSVDEASEVAGYKKNQGKIHISIIYKQ